MPCKLLTWDHRGRERRVGRATREPHGKPPPPLAEGQVPRLVPAPCLRRACDMCAPKGRRQGRPPPATHLRPPRVRDEGGGGVESAPPPEAKAAGWGGGGERVRGGPHDRARRGHAPYGPRRGDHRGCGHGEGKATTGATRHAPPPLQRDQCRASCLRRACNVLTPEGRQRGRPPPPTP